MNAAAILAQALAEQLAQAGQPVTPEWLAECGFFDARMVGDKLCATQDYVTTRALVVGINRRDYYERRYCYQDRGEANEALAKYEDCDQHPSGNWIKVKGFFRGKGIDALNPDHPDLKPWDRVAPR